MAHRLNQMMISTPSSPSSPEKMPDAEGYGRMILGWLLERSLPSLFGHVLPLIGWCALLFWRHIVEGMTWVALLLRWLGG